MGQQGANQKTEEKNHTLRVSNHAVTSDKVCFSSGNVLQKESTATGRKQAAPQQAI